MPNTAAPPTNTSLRAAEDVPELPEAPGAVEVPFIGPLAGTVIPSAVRFTGAGALAAVKLVLSPEAMKTESPPAPTAEVLGAVKGRYIAALSGPGMVPLALVSGMSAPDTLRFW